jgi:hypothetical protein
LFVLGLEYFHIVRKTRISGVGQFAWPFLLPPFLSGQHGVRHQTLRERAESHFSKTPSPSMARERAFEERDAIKAVQD